MNEAPLNYLSAAGARAATILPLTWATLIISIIVCIATGVLVWVGIRRAQSRHGGAAETRSAAVQRGGNGLRWIGWGIAVSSVPLLISLVWTMIALAKVSGPPSHPGLALDITPRQWWWDVRYSFAAPSEIFSTANEIHIPVGTPVLVRLHGADVIHSFWVPQLTGKTDAIPGQTNLSWMQANKVGRFQGQCTEFCGAQHARMAFEVIAQSAEDFSAWKARQLEAAPPPSTNAQARGAAIVEFRCGLCHTVRGTRAAATSAPDLTHLMTRRRIAAGVLPNNPGSLAGWIQAPQGVKPGSLMPNQHLSSTELSDVLQYLETLR